MYFWSWEGHMHSLGSVCIWAQVQRPSLIRRFTSLIPFYLSSNTALFHVMHCSLNQCQPETGPWGLSSAAEAQVCPRKRWQILFWGQYICKVRDGLHWDVLLTHSSTATVCAASSAEVLMRRSSKTLYITGACSKSPSAVFLLGVPAGCAWWWRIKAKNNHGLI